MVSRRARGPGFCIYGGANAEGIADHFSTNHRCPARDDRRNPRDALISTQSGIVSASAPPARFGTGFVAAAQALVEISANRCHQGLDLAVEEVVGAGNDLL